MTMEVFSSKFYKTLDDQVLVSDMQSGDLIVCYELPCSARQSRASKQSNSDTFILPVLLADVNTQRYGTFSRSSQNHFGWPLIVAIPREDARSVDRIEELVVEQLSRWTRYSRELWSWQSTEEPVIEEVQISLSGPIIETVTEIKENGDVVVQETQTEMEESDIVDEKGMMLDDESFGDGLSSKLRKDSIRRLGIKKEVFLLRLQPNVKEYGGGYMQSSNKYEEWDDRRQEASADSLEEEPVLLAADDMLVLEFEGNMKEFYFGDDGALFSSWGEFRHPEYEEAERVAKVQPNRGITLQDCLQEFTKEEQLGEDDLWYCPNCKKHQQATKKFDIWGVPDVLVVHLKRFSNSRTLRDKIDTLVKFPVTGLDLTEMAQERKVARRLRDQGVDIAELGITGDLDEPLLYDLFAVDEHLGGLGGGHYRAYAYNHGTDKWHHFDDSFVTEAEPKDAVVRGHLRRCAGDHRHIRIERKRILALLPPSHVPPAWWEDAHHDRRGARQSAV
jgi:ubiquitin carboxyl-terminal hydrolase 4/11/15